MNFNPRALEYHGDHKFLYATGEMLYLFLPIKIWRCAMVKEVSQPNLNNSHIDLDGHHLTLDQAAASLVLENQSLASPDSIYSLPTSAGQEDFNANSTTAARHLTQTISNLKHILAIELLTAAQAPDLRFQQMPGSKPGRVIAAVRERIRQQIPFNTKDIQMGEYVEIAAYLVSTGELVEITERALDHHIFSS